MKTRKPTSMVRLAAIGSLASMLLLAGCKEAGSSSASASPPQVDVVEVKVSDVKIWDEFNGRVSAIESVDVRPRVTGYITKVAYTEGGEVKKGDLLFVIDPRPYRAALENARAQLERAKAALRLAKQQDGRVQTLLSTKSASREEAEEKRAELETGLSDVHAAESAIAIAALNLEFTEVRAPIDGATSRAKLTVGNLAVADQSVLTSVVSQNPVYVYFDPDEHSYLSYRAALQSAKFSNKGLTARVGLVSDKGFPHEATVGFIDNQVNSATGTIRARAVVNNSDRAFTPGLFARVQFSSGDAIPALLLDDRAVLTDQNRKFVYVLGADNKVVRRDVTLGKMVRGLRVVESGLRSGDKVVVSGLQRIYASGTAVTPNLVHLRLAGADTPSAGPVTSASR